MSRNKTVLQALKWGRELLLEHDIEDGAFVARLFLSHAANMPVSRLLTESNLELKDDVITQFEEMIKKRLTGYPAQYILGEWEFMGYPFFVREGVLIPRADTEILVEMILQKAKKESIQQVLDLGTGTGCIPISLAAHGKMNTVGVDINADAITLAIQNAKRNNTDVSFFLGDLFQALPSHFVGQFDAIVSNPPYIKTNDIAGLMKEVRDFEPHLALDGGEDGLAFYRTIVSQSRLWLRKNGWLFFEIGCEQGHDVSELMKENFENIEIIKDFAGLDRVVLGCKK